MPKKRKTVADTKREDRLRRAVEGESDIYATTADLTKDLDVLAPPELHALVRSMYERLAAQRAEAETHESTIENLRTRFVESSKQRVDLIREREELCREKVRLEAALEDSEDAGAIAVYRGQNLLAHEIAMSEAARKASRDFLSAVLTNAGLEQGRIFAEVSEVLKGKKE